MPSSASVAFPPAQAKLEFGRFLASLLPASASASKTLLANADADESKLMLTTCAKESGALLSIQTGDKDIEAAYNLLITLLVKDSATTTTSATAADADQLLALVQQILKPILDTAAFNPLLKLRILSNLFNCIEKTPAYAQVSVAVYQAIITVAAAGDEMELVFPTLASVDKWIEEWKVDVEIVRSLYLFISEKLGACQDFEIQGFEYKLKYLKTFTNTTAATDLKKARPITISTIKQAIALPQVLNFEDLFNMPAVQSLSSTTSSSSSSSDNDNGVKWFNLLTIFVQGTLQEYRTFAKSNTAFFTRDVVSGGEDANIRKMRLLSLASLAASHLNGEIKYEAIAAALEIPVDEVEIWVIDVIRSGLVDAKMNQLNSTVIVSRCAHRVFGLEQWKQLGAKLDQWKESLGSMMQVIANAKLTVATHGTSTAQ